MNRPAFRCRLEIKVFQGRQKFSVPGNSAGDRRQEFSIRVTHGVRFPPPPCPAPLRERVRTARAAAATLDAFRSRRPFALAARPGPRGARICRSGCGRDRRWLSGNSSRPAPRSHRLTPKRQRCQRPTPFPGMAGSPGRFLPSVQFSFLVHRSRARTARASSGQAA
jgi:hypothetical protein